MHKKSKLVLLSVKMVILGLIIHTGNQIMWKLNEKRSLHAYRLFYLADKILENRRTQFCSAEMCYLNLYTVVV